MPNVTSKFQHLMIVGTDDCGFVAVSASEWTFARDPNDIDQRCRAQAEFRATSTFAKPANLCASHTVHVITCAQCLAYLDKLEPLRG